MKAITASEPNNELQPGLWPAHHSEYLLNFALSKVSDRGQAEDLVQDTYVAAWKGRHGFRGDCTERTWLTGILRNKVIDHYRASARRPVVREADVISIDTAGNQGSWMEAQAAESTGSDPIEMAEQREFMTVLDDALTNLPEAAGRAFRMREILGYSTDEIADELNISRGNLWVLIHRAKAALKSQLEVSWAA